LQPDEYMAKARRALGSAAVLLAEEDFEGSINRAYYAMFHAARCALATNGIETRSRKHGTLVGQFSRHLVAEGKLPKDLGRALNDVQKLRRVGDYDEPGIPRGDAEEALARAREFVSAIERLLPG